MYHDSLKTSAFFGICMFCGSIINGLTVITSSTAIPWAAIEDSIWRVFLLV